MRKERSKKSWKDSAAARTEARSSEAVVVPCVPSSSWEIPGVCTPETDCLCTLETFTIPELLLFFSSGDVGVSISFPRLSCRSR